MTGALQELRSHFPELRLIVLSPLAEVDDLLLAEVGLELGAQLIVPLALPLDLYVEDFSTAESRAQFQRLLAQAVVLGYSGS